MEAPEFHSSLPTAIDVAYLLNEEPFDGVEETPPLAQQASQDAPPPARRTAREHVEHVSGASARDTLPHAAPTQAPIPTSGATVCSTEESPVSNRRPPRGRGRARGRGVVRRRSTRGAAARRTPRMDQTDASLVATRMRADPTAGWSIVASHGPTAFEDEETVVADAIDGRAKCYVDSVRHNVERELSAHAHLSDGLLGYVLLLVEPVLQLQKTWINETVALRDLPDDPVTHQEMLKHFALLILSQLTNLSMEKAREVMGSMGLRVPPLERLRFIGAHLCAFSPTVDEAGGGETWTAQRDPTHHVTNLETVAMERSRRMFFVPLHQVVTLDDDLMGTRAQDNPVKMLSPRKADKEGHCADVVADALFRLVLLHRFRRRGEDGATGVRAVLSALTDGRGETSLVSCILAADRGYGKPEFIDVIRRFRLSTLLIHPTHNLRSHPFVALSQFKPGTNMPSDDEDDLDVLPGTASSASAGASGADDRGPEEDNALAGMQTDRPARFVIPNLQGEGNTAVTARMSVPGLAQDYRACAVREAGALSVSKVLLFSYMLPQAMRRRCDGWTWVTRSGDMPPKNILVPLAEYERTSNDPVSTALLETLQGVLRGRCHILTVGQRCADWFVLRQFRITATLAEDVFAALDWSDATVALFPTAKERTHKEWIGRWTDSWFSTRRSTEAMMRGTRNEDTVIDCFDRASYVFCTRTVGLLARNDAPFIACSPDGVCFLEISDELERRGWSGSYFIQRREENQVRKFVLATIEVKTAVAESSLGDRILDRASTDAPLFAQFGIPDSPDNALEYIPLPHLIQCLHQVVVVGADCFVYIAAAETGVLYPVIVFVPHLVRLWIGAALKDFLATRLGWLHDTADASSIIYPPWLPSATRMRIRSRAPFAKDLFAFVTRQDRRGEPLPPVRTFRHGLQMLYSKLKGGVDGSTQYRAILRASTSASRWSSKVVVQLLKTLLINGFISWRIVEQRKRHARNSTTRSGGVRIVPRRIGLGV